MSETLRRTTRRTGGYWLISALHEAEASAAMLLDEGRTLPVFSFEEEAMLFLRARRLEGRWEIRHKSPAELFATLRRSPGRISRVTLDPIPENIFSGAYGLLLSLDLREFMQRLAATDGTPTKNGSGDGFSGYGPARALVEGRNDASA